MGSPPGRTTEGSKERLSVRPCVHPSVRPSVRPPVRPSVRPSARPSVRPSVGAPRAGARRTKRAGVLARRSSSYNRERETGREGRRSVGDDASERSSLAGALSRVLALARRASIGARALRPDHHHPHRASGASDHRPAHGACLAPPPPPAMLAPHPGDREGAPRQGGLRRVHGRGLALGRRRDVRVSGAPRPAAPRRRQWRLRAAVVVARRDSAHRPAPPPSRPPPIDPPPPPHPHRLSVSRARVARLHARATGSSGSSRPARRSSCSAGARARSRRPRSWRSAAEAIDTLGAVCGRYSSLFSGDRLTTR